MLKCRNSRFFYYYFLNKKPIFVVCQCDHAVSVTPFEQSCLRNIRLIVCFSRTSIIITHKAGS